jgi:hypothetical protein
MTFKGGLVVGAAGALLVMGSWSVAYAAPVGQTVTATEYGNAGAGTDAAPGDLTALYENGALLCQTNENTSACGGGTIVSDSFLSASTIASINSGTPVSFGVNLCDDLTNCALFPTSSTISDQLYVTVSNNDGNSAFLNWCWDSDLEPNNVICNTTGANGGPTLTSNFDNVLETTGFMDLTSYFTSGTGPFAGAWNVQALSDAPEPLTLSVFGAGLLGAVAMRRRRKAKAST